MSKEHAYAYEAGYRDGSINYELEHCSACKNVADLQEALDENARLRDLMYDRAHDYAIQHMTEDELRIIATNMMDENCKLRELLQMALTSHNKMCTNRGTCSGCLFFKAKPFAPACPIVSVTRDARELGVEVPDGD